MGTSQYLALCSFFKDQNIQKQKELLKSNKTFAICLNPKTKCRKDPSDTNSPCQFHLNWELKCSCGDKFHHHIMCPHPKSENSYYQEANRGRGGFQRGRGGCGGCSHGRGRQPNERRREQNNQALSEQGSVSPPRMDLSYEEEIPILFSPLTDHEDNSNDQPGEYFEQDYLENENNNYSTSAFNEIPLSTADCQDINSESSWDELMKLESELDEISDIEDGECSPSPPRKLPKKTKKPKIPKRLNKTLKKLKTYPTMFSKVVVSN